MRRPAHTHALLETLVCVLPLARTVNFAGAITHAASLLTADASAMGPSTTTTTTTTPSILTVEMGPHPALTPLATDLLSANGVAVLHGACSMRRNQPESFWEEELARLTALLQPPAPSAAPATAAPHSDALLAGTTTTTAAAAAAPSGRSLDELESLILSTVNGALAASGLDTLAVETPADRAHTLTIGFMDLGLDSHDATAVIQRLREIV